MNKNILKFLLVVALIINFMLFLNMHNNQMPKYDDIYYYKMLDGIDKFGIPLVFRGIGTGHHYGGGVYGDYINGLAHPPLGTYILYFFYKLLSDSIFSLRFFGYLMSLLTIFLIFKICKQLFRDKTKRESISYVVSIVYLLSPVVIQKSTYQSMDTLFYPALLALFVYLFLKHGETKYNYILFGILFGIILLIKYTTVCFLILSIFIYYLLQKKFYKAISVTFWTCLIGFSIFLISLGTYSLYFPGTLTETLRYTLFGRVATSASFGVIVRHLFSTIAYDTFWLSPALVLFFITSLLQRTKLLFQIRKIKKIDFLWIFVIITWVAYSIKAPDIYYKFPLYGLFLILIFSQFKYNKIDLSFLSISLLTIISLLSFLPDPFLVLPKLLPFTSTTLLNLLVLSLYFVPLVIFVFTKNKININLCLLLVISFFIVLNIQQATADYSTVNLYGEKGYNEMIQYVKENLKLGNAYVVRDDMGFWIGGEYFRADEFTKNNHCGIDNSLIYRTSSSCGSIIGPYDVNHVNKFKTNEIKYFIYSEFLNEYLGGIAPDIQKILDSNYKLDAEFGHFKIYSKTGDLN